VSFAQFNVDALNYVNDRHEDVTEYTDKRVWSCTNVEGQQYKWLTTVALGGGKHVLFKLNSNADISILSYESLVALQDHVTLAPSTTKIHGIGQQVIEPFGKVELFSVLDDRGHTTCCQAVNGKFLTCHISSILYKGLTRH